MSEPPPPPFQPVPIEPLRVESLEYQTPSTGPIRPGIIVAVGTISILMGCIGILMSGSSVMMAVMYASMRGMAASVATANVHIHDTTARPAPVMMVPQARAIAIAGLVSKAPLTPLRSQMLDELLTQAGDQMFPFAEAAMTEEKVAASVNAFGQTTDSAGNQVQYFIIANGRVEIGDNQASFSPTHGVAVQVYRDDDVANNSPAAAQTTTMPTLPPFFTRGPTSLRPFVLYGIGSAISLLLALYLIVIGILVLSGNRRGRGLHLVFAVLKIPVEIFAGIAYLMAMSQMFGNLVGNLGGLGSTTAGVYSTVLTLLACAYPVALLIVMNTRGVKQYYNSIAK